MPGSRSPEDSDPTPLARAAREADKARTPPFRPLGYTDYRYIGRGSQGQVFQCTEELTKRVVAIKFAHTGSNADKFSRELFHREVRTLSNLAHPNIVAIYTAQESPDGMFFVMPYVDGSSLTDYTRARPCPLVSRLCLFRTICLAVAAAHDARVVHRDLKPSNMLVDTDGVPHVLDFGLAGTHVYGLNDFSQTQRVGSIPYAAPELIEQKYDKSSYQADVYSLGVILFEVIAGRLPYPSQLNDKPGLIKDALEHKLVPLTDRYQSPIPAPLKSIVLHALERESSKRYKNAGDLAADIEAFLRHDRIRAHNGGALYKTTCYAWQKRRLIAIVAAATLPLVLLLTVSLGYRASTARETALRIQNTEQATSLATVSADLQSSLDLQQTLDDERKLQTTRADSAERDLTTAVNSLRETDLVVQAAVDGFLRPLLEQGALGTMPEASIAQRVIGQVDAEAFRPAGIWLPFPSIDSTIRARVLDRAARALTESRHTSAAVIIANAALESARQCPDRHVVARTLVTLGAATMYDLHYAEALTYLSDAVAQEGQLSNPDDAILVSALIFKATVLLRQDGLQDALAAAEQAHDIAHGARFVGTALHGQASLTRATALRYHSEFQCARDAAEESLTLFRLSGDTATLIAQAEGVLATIAEQEENYPRAERHGRTALAMFERGAGKSNPSTCTARHNLAKILARQGQYSEAIDLLDDNLSIRLASLDVADPDLIRSLSTLAALLVFTGRADDAMRILGNAIAFARASPASPQSQIAGILVTLGDLCANQSRLKEARAYYSEARTLYTATHGAESRECIQVAIRLATLLRYSGDWAQARSDLVALLEGLRKAGSVLALEMLSCLCELGDTHLACYDLRTAEEYYSEALLLNEVTQPSAILYAAEANQGLAAVFLALGDLAKAEATCQKALVAREACLPSCDIRCCRSRHLLADVLAEKGSYERCLVLLDSVDADYGRLLPGDHWLKAASTATRGVALLRSGQVEEARPLLRLAFDVLSKSNNVPLPYIVRVCERSAQLYNDIGMESEAKRWQERACELVRSGWSTIE